MEENDIQRTLFDKIKTKLPIDEKLADKLMELLHISLDASYRRIRGEVALTIHETQILLDAYDISLGNLGTYKKEQIIFSYKPLSYIDTDFENYLTLIRDSMREVKRLANPHIYISVSDTPTFQLFNFPHLTRFKFFFWAKSYLKIPTYQDKKFKREKINPEVLKIGIEAHNIYHSIPSSELYSPEALRGILRQIEYYFEADMFEEPAYVLVLLDNFSDLSAHMEKQAELGHKFTYGNEANLSPNSSYKMYYNDTFLPDNTFYVEYDGGASTYFTHNIMNFITTNDPAYNKDTKMILNRLFDNSTLISEVSVKERSRFFSALNKAILNFRKRIELTLEE